MYILRGARNALELETILMRIAQPLGCGFYFSPTNNLLLNHTVSVDSDDFIFEICDSFESSDASLILSYGNYPINGKKPSLPLFERLNILQVVASECMPYAQKLEIYLGEDTPFFPDYSDHTVVCSEIANTLYLEYELENSVISGYVPCVHLNVVADNTKMPDRN